MERRSISFWSTATKMGRITWGNTETMNESSCRQLRSLLSHLDSLATLFSATETLEEEEEEEDEEEGLVGLLLGSQ